MSEGAEPPSRRRWSRRWVDRIVAPRKIGLVARSLRRLGRPGVSGVSAVPTTPRSIAGDVAARATSRTPSPPVFSTSYPEGEKRWRGPSAAIAEIECAIIVDYVTRVKRLAPCVPRFVGYDARRTTNGTGYVEYALRTEHVDNLTMASIVDPHGRHADPTLEAYVRGDDLARDPEGFRRRLEGVFVQVLLALSGLQRHCGFVHNDFHTKNVLLAAREGTGPLVVRDAASGRRYVFEDDVPLVKIIDFGDAMVRHPETGRVVNSRWTGPIQGFTNGADLMKFAVVLARHDRHVRSTRGESTSLFSDAMTADLVSILDPIDGDVSTLDLIAASANANPNVERFGFPLVGFATPRNSSRPVASRDVSSTRKSRVAPENIFHELPDDAWSSDRPFSWFEDAREETKTYGATVRVVPYSVTPPELSNSKPRLRGGVLRPPDPHHL